MPNRTVVLIDLVAIFLGLIILAIFQFFSAYASTFFAVCEGEGVGCGTGNGMIFLLFIFVLGLVGDVSIVLKILHKDHFGRLWTILLVLAPFISIPLSLLLMIFFSSKN